MVNSLRIYENIEAERDRVEACIKKYGWTSDHNLDWFVDTDVRPDAGAHHFIEFEDGSGLLATKYDDEWRIYSDPLTLKEKAAERIAEFAQQYLGGPIERIWCDYVTDHIRPELLKLNRLKINDIHFSLQYLLMDLEKFDLNLPGKHLKEIRNARSKFYREHRVESVDARGYNREEMEAIVRTWRMNVVKKQDEEDVCDNWYVNAIRNNFRGFKSARVIKADGKAVGINGGYEVVNNSARWAGIIGIHDYSHRDLAAILWLEDIEWIKKAGYRELDMQGWEEDDPALEFEKKLGGRVDRITDTFSMEKKLIS